MVSEEATVRPRGAPVCAVHWKPSTSAGSAVKRSIFAMAMDGESNLRESCAFVTNNLDQAVVQIDKAEGGGRPAGSRARDLLT